MNTFFGLISRGALALIAVGIVGTLLLALVLLASRYGILLRIGLRNILRRGPQTLLILAGLVLSTVLIMTAFGLGDSLGYSLIANKLNQIGNVDEYASTQAISIGNPLPYLHTTEAQQILSVAHNDRQIAFAEGAIFSGGFVPLSDEMSKQISGKNMLIAVPPDFNQVWGPLQSNQGQALNFASLQPGDTFLSQGLATKLNAKVGDTLHVIINQKPVTYTVRAILNTSVNLDESNATGTGNNSLIVPLAQFQQLVGRTGQVNIVFIRNVGTGGLDDLGPNNSTSVAVTNHLQNILNGYSIQSLKQDAFVNAQNAASAATSLVLIIGLVLMGVGLLLIYLIFMMLAAERQEEMGMSRAIGMKRSHLTLTFVFEGMAYTLLSSGIGLLLGIGMVAILIEVFGNNSTLLELLKTPLQMHIDWTSPLLSYCLGTTVTFLAVAVSANRVSRMNIIAAIRHLDEEQTSDGDGSSIWVLGPFGLVAGIVILGLGLNNQLLVPYMTGVSLLIVGIGMTICWLVNLLELPQKNITRITLSVTSILLLVYLLRPFGQVEDLLGLSGVIGITNFHPVDSATGLMFVFASCFLTVPVAIWFFLVNGHWITNAFEGLFAFSGRFAALVRTSTQYPLTYKSRTGLTIALFALVSFLIVFMVTANFTYVQTYGNLDQVLGGWELMADMPANLSQLPTAVTTNPKMLHDFQVIAGTGVTFLQMNQTGSGAQTASGSYGLAVADDAYLSNTTYTVQPRAVGYSSSRAVWDAVKNEVGDVVLYDDPTHPIPGVKVTDTTFQPFFMEVTDAQGHPQRLKVIGILTAHALQVLSFISARTDSVLLQNRISKNAHVRYYFRARAGVDVNQARLDLGAALSPYGIEPVVVTDAFTAQAVAPNSFQFNFLASYIALGLIIGIAGLGIISSRAVVERRQQIGLLRAIGLKKRLVQGLFLLESSYVAGLGLGIGTILGLLAANQFLHLQFIFATMTMQVPVLELAAILLGAYLTTLFSTYLPAQAAMKVRPAEALRYE